MSDYSSEKLMQLLDERVDRLRKITLDLEERRRRSLVLVTISAAVTASFVVFFTILYSTADVATYRNLNLYVPTGAFVVVSIFSSALFFLRTPQIMYRSLRQEIIVARKLVGRASVLVVNGDRDDQLILDIKLGEAEALISWAEGLIGHSNTRLRDIG